MKLKTAQHTVSPGKAVAWRPLRYSHALAAYVGELVSVWSAFEFHRWELLEALGRARRDDERRWQDWGARRWKTEIETAARAKLKAAEVDSLLAVLETARKSERNALMHHSWMCCDEHTAWQRDPEKPHPPKERTREELERLITEAKGIVGDIRMYLKIARRS
jgi:hypothetical protein